jgi:hypothetical protein
MDNTRVGCDMFIQKQFLTFKNYFSVFGPSFGPLCAFLYNASSLNYSYIAFKAKFGVEVKKDLDFSMYSFFDKVNNETLAEKTIV